MLALHQRGHEEAALNGPTETLRMVTADAGEDLGLLETAFREAMAKLAGAVVVVTCEVDGRPWGLTVSACCSVSVSPPIILVSLGRHTVSRQQIVSSGWFGINVLAADNLPAARHGAVAGAPKFVDDHCEPVSGTRSPLVAGALAQIDCAVNRTVEVGDHTLVLGDVRGVRNGSRDGRPLLYFDRAFRAVGAPLG